MKHQYDYVLSQKNYEMTFHVFSKSKKRGRCFQWWRFWRMTAYRRLLLWTFSKFSAELIMWNHWELEAYKESEKSNSNWSKQKFAINMIQRTVIDKQNVLYACQVAKLNLRYNRVVFWDHYFSLWIQMIFWVPQNLESIQISTSLRLISAVFNWRLAWNE